MIQKVAVMILVTLETGRKCMVCVCVCVCWCSERPSLLRSAEEKVSQIGDTVVFECLSHPASRGSSAQLRVDWLKDGQPIATSSLSPDPQNSQTVATSMQSSPLGNSQPNAADSQLLQAQGGQPVLSLPASRGSSAQLRVDWLKDGQPIATSSQSPDPQSSQTVAVGMQSSPLRDSQSIAANSELLKAQAGQPVSTDVQSQPRRRHFLIADSQILVLIGACHSDAGVYTCIVSNAAGSQRAVSKLRVIDSPLTASSKDETADDDNDDMLTIHVGLVVIAAVCGVVLTSLAWVVIIYCLQRRHDLATDSASSTSTDETMIPVAAAAVSEVNTLDSLHRCVHLTPGISLNLLILPRIATRTLEIFHQESCLELDPFFSGSPHFLF